MQEIENELRELEKKWIAFAEGDCYRFARLRIRAGQLAKMQNLVEKRIAQWLSKLQELGDNLLKQLINAPTFTVNHLSEWIGG